MLLKDFQITKKEPLTPHHYRIRLDAPEIAEIAHPGQFLHIRVTGGIDPLLRRPFSIHKVENGGVEVLFKVVGKGTELLAKKRVGEKVNVLGPLGKRFKAREQEKVLLVAGGVGVAPLFFLAQRLKRSFTVLIGAKNKWEIVCEEEMRNLGVDVEVATEDGSYGHHGTVGDLLQGLHPHAIYACGPTPMLMEVVRFAKKRGIFCEVSLETKMGCGVGACLGCAVKIGSSYRYVCKDGPVFEGELIDEGA